MAKKNISEQNKPSEDFSDIGNIEIGDVENFRSDKLQVFNHQVLVMEVLRRVNESGSHELRSGWFNESIDHNGNVKRVYIEDTRKKYIECVRTAMNTMSCDYDEEAETTINEFLETLDKEKEKLLKMQWDWYSSLPPKHKEQITGTIIRGMFNIDYGWYLKFIELEVECYRAIAQELNSLTKRLDYYQAEEFEA